MNSKVDRLIWDVKEEELKLSNIQIERYSILKGIVKYVQYNQHPIGHYGVEVKAPEERYSTKMYKTL